MGENDPELERLKSILEDPDAERELKVGRLHDLEFFSKSPERDGFLMRWFLNPRNTDPHVLFATNESLGRRIEGGAKYPEEVLCEVRDASESENPIAKQRALGVIKIMESKLEMESTRRLWKHLFGANVPKEKKKSTLEYSGYFASRRENADVLVEFLTSNVCDEELFKIGLGTYGEMNKEGMGLHITDVQLSYIGGALNSGEEAVRERGEKIYCIAAKYVPRGVLEHPAIPEKKKLEMLAEKERFTSDMPRSVSVLIDFMLDSDLCAVNESIREAARDTFQSLLDGGLLLTEHHLKRVVGMMVADPSLDILQAEQRENAFWMFKQLVRKGFEIPRNHQGRIMKSAGEIWPRVKDEPRKEEWRLKKLYGLKAIELILAVWLVELKEGRKSGWPFRPEDRALISYDTSHEDKELRDAAIRVDALIDEIDDEISASESAIRRSAAILKAKRCPEEIIREYIREQMPPGGPAKETLEGVLADAEREADEEIAAMKGNRNGNGVEIAKVEPARRAPAPPREEEPECVAEMTPIALSREVLERQASEANGDKPGLPPKIEQALKRLDKLRKKVPEDKAAPAKLWPPPDGGKKK